MQSLIDKYEKILQKPQPEPFKGYIEELLAHIKGDKSYAADKAAVGINNDDVGRFIAEQKKPRPSKKIDGMKPYFKGEFYTPTPD